MRGDLGFDYYHGVPVTTLIADALPKTLSLALGAAVIWLILGVFNGVVSAVHPRSVADRGLTAFALFFYSMPTFLLGLLLPLLLLLPAHPGRRARVSRRAATSRSPRIRPRGLQHLVLPWLTLALVLAATYTRLTRGSMLDVLGEDYIRTARAKGLRERRVVYRHGLRAALTPVLTQFGIDLGTLVGGVIVTETVFSIDGLGQDRRRRDQHPGPAGDHRDRAGGRDLRWWSPTSSWTSATPSSTRGCASPDPPPLH